MLNRGDHRYWVQTLKRTYHGDANLDGEFGTADLTKVFQAGLYERDDQPAGWAQGDWNGDGRFNTADLVVSFQDGGYERGPRDLSEPTVEVIADDPVSVIAQLIGQAEPYVLVQVNDQAGFTDADANGRFQIDVDLSQSASELIVRVADLSGNQTQLPVVLQNPQPSVDDLVDYAPWGEYITDALVFPELPRSLVTALTPQGVSRLSLSDAPQTKEEVKPAIRRSAFSDQSVLVAEDTSRVNDEPEQSQPIPMLEAGSEPVIISGELEPSPTELVPQEDDGDILKATETGLTSTPNQAVIANATIGDGRFGSGGAGTGDFDFYAVRGVQPDQIITIDINTPSTSELDSFILVWDSTGELVDVNDDEGFSNDSFLEFKVREAGDYFISVAGFGSFGPVDPFDSSSGLAADSEGDYEIIISVDVTQEVDSYSIDLQPGDIFGAAAIGGARHMTLRDPDGEVLIGSGQDVTFIHPETSPLPGGGNVALSWVADTAGAYSLSVDSGVGQYDVETAIFRPVLESEDRNTRQVLFLDFDGASINAQELFGLGNAEAQLAPMSSYLANWGLSQADEDAVIDAVVAVVQENFDDIRERGENGDRSSDGIDGHFDIEIVTSRDSQDALGFDFDPFGAANVSRVIVGGSVEELGIQTIGIAEAVDVGNFHTTDTAVVLLDILSGPSTSASSLNQYEIADSASMIDLVGVGVGNIVAHEAGHFFAGWHTNQFNDLAVLMDQGGNMANTVGVGADRIFGTDDDVDVDYGSDTFVRNEGFTGTSNTLNAIAFGLSTGTIDPGMVIVGSTPADNQQLNTPPDQFTIQFIDDFVPNDLPVPDEFTVNGIAADQVRVNGPRELTFEFSQSPVVNQGLQVMNLAAGAVVRSGDLTPSQAFAANFGYDAQLMEITAVTPSQFEVTLPLDEIIVTVNEPYDPSSVGIEDLELSQGRVTGFRLIDETTVAYSLDAVVTEGLFEVVMPDGALADAFGNRGNGLDQSHLLDIGLIPFSAPQVAKLPLGSAGYESTMHGGVSSDDVDGFAFSVDPGQTLSLVLRTEDTLQGSIELWSGDRLVDTASAAVPGQTVLLQTEAVSGQLIGRRENLTDFEVRVSGLESTVGAYSIQVLLNAVWEGEAFGKTVNDTAALAESLEPSYLYLAPQAAQRAAILGNLSRTPTSSEGFESGVLDGSWTTTASTDFGRTFITDEYGAASGSFALLMDTSFPLENLNEAIWEVDLNGISDPILTFSHANFDDERDPFSGDFDGSFEADGIAVSDDGVSWHPIFDAPDSPSGVWEKHYLDLAEVTADSSINLDGTFWIKFQQFDNQPLAFDGRGWDDIAIRRTDSADWYSFEARQRDTVTVAAKAFGEGVVELDLFDEEGTLVAEGLNIHRPLVNGSFEQGNLHGWTVETTGPTNRPWQVTASNRGGALFIQRTTPQDGRYVAWNGFEGDGPMQYRMFQDVSIPEGAQIADLTWQYRAQWTFYVNGAEERTLSLQVVDPEDDQVLETLHFFSTGSELQAGGGDTGWLTLTHDLKAYAGSTVRLTFVENIPESFTGPAQIEFDGISLDLGQQLPANVDDLIGNYVVPRSGTYYVRATGDPLTKYSLVTTRNVAFGIESDDSSETAQPVVSAEVQGRRWLLGYLDDADRDLYEISLSTGQPLSVVTQTPADGVGQFANVLDPVVRLYNSAGELVAEDDNSASDGFNASLRYRVPRDEAGTYFLEVSSMSGSRGEYVVSIQGADVPERSLGDIAASLAADSAAGTPDDEEAQESSGAVDNGAVDNVETEIRQATDIDTELADTVFGNASESEWMEPLANEDSEPNDPHLDDDTGSLPA